MAHVSAITQNCTILHISRTYGCHSLDLYNDHQWKKKKPLNALSTNNSTSLSLSPCPNKRLKYQRWLPKEPVYVCLLKRCCISRLLMLPVSMSWVTGGSESYITSSVALFNSSDLSSWSRREGREGEGDRMLLLPSRECLADKHFWSCCGMIKFTYRQ